MTDTQKQFVQALIEKTESGAITWQSTSLLEQFALKLTKTTILISYSTQYVGDGNVLKRAVPDHVALIILDSIGDTIGELKVTATHSDFELLYHLYEQVKESRSGSFDQSLKDILQNELK